MKTVIKKQYNKIYLSRINKIFIYIYNKKFRFYLQPLKNARAYYFDPFDPFDLDLKFNFAFK